MNRNHDAPLSDTSIPRSRQEEGNTPNRSPDAADDARAGTDREGTRPEWYLSEDFWHTFYTCMFNEETFAAGAQQVEALLELAGDPGRAVLDLGAGPGRHALPLARSGYNVTAVDTSRLLLDRLAAHADGLAIDIVEQDMRHFRRPGHFDLALLMWTSFGYFDHPEDHLRVLRNVRASLAPGGRLVLDLVGKEYLCRHLQPVHLTEYDDGSLLIERPVLGKEMTRLDNEWILLRGDSVQRAHFSHAVWSAAEIHTLLATADMTVDGLYGSLDGNEYDLDAERLIVIAGR